MRFDQRETKFIFLSFTYLLRTDVFCMLTVQSLALILLQSCAIGFLQLVAFSGDVSAHPHQKMHPASLVGSNAHLHQLCICKPAFTHGSRLPALACTDSAWIIIYVCLIGKKTLKLLITISLQELSLLHPFPVKPAKESAYIRGQFIQTPTLHYLPLKIISDFEMKIKFVQLMAI